jgi:hypothetical protein
MRRLLAAAPAAVLLLLASACGSSSGTGQAEPTASGVFDQTSPSAAATNTGGAPATQNTGNTGGNTQAQWPSPEDCVSYNPSNVKSRYEAGIWAIVDGNIEVMRLHGGPSENVGEKGVALAKRFRRHCYLGRNNTREEKYSYIFDYWRDPSGQNPAIADQEDDCSPYDKNNLTVENMGSGQGWRVKDHDHVLHLFDNETDARNGKLVLSKYNQICFIGNPPDSNQGQDQVSYQL